jgi:hypothetical protein
MDENEIKNRICAINSKCEELFSLDYNDSKHTIPGRQNNIVIYNDNNLMFCDKSSAIPN